MKKIIKGKAPLRIDLAGAWSDIPFYCDLYGGTTINAAIDIYTNGQIIFEEDGRFKFEYNLDFPSGSGLGSSGALNVLYYAMINHRDFINGDLSKKDIALGAYKIERVLGANCGKQDQCAAAFGGISCFHFGAKQNRYNIKGEIIRQSDIKRTNIQIYDGINAFSERILLIDTKIIHSSSEIINEIQTLFEKDKNNYSFCSSSGKIRNLIRDMVDSTFVLKKVLAPQEVTFNDSVFIKKYPTDWEKVGEIISYQFDIMQEMSSKTTNNTIERIIKEIQPYIYGAKPGGAGGGGCIIVLCKSLEHKEGLKKKMRKDKFLNNFDYYDVNIDTEGVKVWEEK